MLWVLLLSLSACGDDGPGLDAGADAEPDAEPDAGPAGCATGDYGCRDLSFEDAPCEAGDRACTLRLVWNETMCPAGASCPVTVLFAGGDAACARPLDGDTVYSRTARFWADRGFVFLCAQPFASVSQTAAQPFFEEVPRVRWLISSTLAQDEVRSRGDVAQLSLQGISHGGYNLLTTYLSGETVGAPTHIVIYDAGGDIARTEHTFWEEGVASGNPILPILHGRFVGRLNGGAMPDTHPSTVSPFCGGEDPETDLRYRRDSTDWACVDEPGYLGSAWSCDDLVVRARWRLYGCDDDGVLDDVDLPDHEVECTTMSLASCPGVDATYAAITTCTHASCFTPGCAADDACEWITGRPCD